jgi:hypothetical protein
VHRTDAVSAIRGSVCVAMLHASVSSPWSRRLVARTMREKVRLRAYSSEPAARHWADDVPVEAAVAAAQGRKRDARQAELGDGVDEGIEPGGDVLDSGWLSPVPLGGQVEDPASVTEGGGEDPARLERPRRGAERPLSEDRR